MNFDITSFNTRLRAAQARCAAVRQTEKGKAARAALNWAAQDPERIPSFAQRKLREGERLLQEALEEAGVGRRSVSSVSR